MIQANSAFAARLPLVGVATLVAIVTLSTPSISQPAAEPPAAAEPLSANVALAEAKDLFRKGVVLFEAGDTERALDFFLRSRARFASSRNTINAAICLERLGRLDEALEMYEDVLTKFASELDEENRNTIAPAMASLRKRVGSLDISANVDGAVVIDGRARGKLPLSAPIRALSGKHVVRVLKDGYSTSETTVTVPIGQTVKVDARLAPLAAAGSLRVEDPVAMGADVFVDRVAVGTAPWEGTLGPGSHVVWTRKDEIGSAPTGATVIQGQTVLVRVKSGQLGGPVRIDLSPPTAELALDAVPLGSGSWEGRLPMGTHSVDASEAGYVTRTIPFASAGNPLTLPVKLAIDPSHPRWPKAGVAGRLWVEGFGGYAFVSSLKSAAEGECPAACSKGPSAGGGLGGARTGYRFPAGLSLEVAGGYMALASSVSRTKSEHYGDTGQYPITYALNDSLKVNGPFAAGGISERVGLGPRFDFLGRVSAGVLFAKAVDEITGTASTGGPTAAVSPGSTPDRTVAVFVMPEAGLDLKLGPVHVGASVALALFVNEGPTLKNGSLTVPLGLCPPGSDPASVGCASGSAAVKDERGFGRMVLAIPELSAGYTF